MRFCQTCIYAFCLLFIADKLLAQAPDTIWEHCFGGVYQDQAQSVQFTLDGGSIILGSTGCRDHDVKGNHGGVDYWLLKLDSKGKIQWQKCLGGYQDDFGWGGVTQTSDKGYIVAGYSYSKDSAGEQVTGNHGAADYWVAKLNDTGKIEWEQSFGGHADDAAYDVIQTKDGGYLLAGSTLSNSGEIYINHGLIDAWIIKLDNKGTIQWSRTYGGSGYDGANTVLQTKDGNYVFAGYTTSADSDLVNRPIQDTTNTDLWVMKIDTSGNPMWSKWYGGKGEEEAFGMAEAKDSSLIITGYTTSKNDGDVSGYHDSGDCWLIHINKNGNLLWQKCLGGSGRDTAYDVTTCKDGGFIAAGFTTSNDYDVQGNHGNKDMWVVKLDSMAHVVWQKCLGGTRSDGASSLDIRGDSSLILAGWSYSHDDGDVHGHHNLSFPPGFDIDYWIVCLGYNSSIKTIVGDSKIKVWPNPADKSLVINVEGEKQSKQVNIYSMLGVLVYSVEMSNQIVCNVNNLASGVYILEVKGEMSSYYKKLMIGH